MTYVPSLACGFRPCDVDMLVLKWACGISLGGILFNINNYSTPLYSLIGEQNLSLVSFFFVNKHGSCFSITLYLNIYTLQC